MATKMQDNQAMGQANKGKVTQTLDFITDKIKGEFVLLPQFIYSSDKEFNGAIKLDMDTDACLEDTDGGYENLFQSGGYYGGLPDDAVFSGEMYSLITVVRLYSGLLDKGNEDAGINLMTMLFRIYQKTGYLKNHYYSTMKKCLQQTMMQPHISLL